MGLAVSVGSRCAASHVKEELGLAKVFFIAGDNVEFGQCHLSNLMSGHSHQLAFVRPDFTAHTVGITTGYVEKLMAACSLIMCAGSVYHVSQVIELVA